MEEVRFYREVPVKYYQNMIIPDIADIPVTKYLNPDDRDLGSRFYLTVSALENENPRVTVIDAHNSYAELKGDYELIEILADLADPVNDVADLFLGGRYLLLSLLSLAPTTETVMDLQSKLERIITEDELYSDFIFNRVNTFSTAYVDLIDGLRISDNRETVGNNMELFLGLAKVFLPIENFRYHLSAFRQTKIQFILASCYFNVKEKDLENSLTYISSVGGYLKRKRDILIGLISKIRSLNQVSRQVGNQYLPRDLIRETVKQLLAAMEVVIVKDTRDGYPMIGGQFLVITEAELQYVFAYAGDFSKQVSSKEKFIDELRKIYKTDKQVSKKALYEYLGL